MRLVDFEFDVKVLDQVRVAVGLRKGSDSELQIPAQQELRGTRSAKREVNTGRTPLGINALPAGPGPRVSFKLGYRASKRSEMARITVVNNNPEFLELVRDILESDRYEATAIDADQPGALDRIRTSVPDLLMIDLRLGQEGSDGWDLARQLRSESSFAGIPVLVCSGDLAALNEIEPDVTDNPRVETLAKPFGIDELTGAIDRLLAEPVGG